MLSKNIIYDKWLSEIIGKEAYTLNLDKNFILRSENFGTEENKWIVSIKENEINSTFIQAKVPTDTINYIKYLERIGFDLIDTNVLFKKYYSESEKTYVKKNSDQIHIRFAKKKDKNQTVTIADSSFIYSRFHLDPKFNLETANAIKAKWVSNYFEGNRGDQMVVAVLKNRVIGFLQIIKAGNENVIIDLVGVLNKFKRKGIAKRMIDFAIYKNKGNISLSVGTQIGNIPSINLYQKMNFLLEKSSYVFHYHTD